MKPDSSLFCDLFLILYRKTLARKGPGDLLNTLDNPLIFRVNKPDGITLAVLEFEVNPALLIKKQPSLKYLWIIASFSHL